MRVNFGFLPPLVCYGLASLATQGLSGPRSPKIVTDRPTEGAGPAVVLPMFVQIEGGYRASGSAGSTSQDVPDALLRFGVARGWEARVSWTGWTLRGDSWGTNDVGLGAKHVLARGRGGAPALSALGEVSLPVGGEGFSESSVSTKLLALLSTPVDDRWGLTWNAGLRFAGASAGPARVADRQLIYTAALTLNATSELTVFAELYGGLALAGEGRAVHRFQAGLTAFAGARTQWDFRVGVGLSHSAPDWSIGVGYSARFPR